MKTLRRTALLLASALGLVAASTAPGRRRPQPRQPLRACNTVRGLIMTTLRRSTLLVATAGDCPSREEDFGCSPSAGDRTFA